MPCRNMFSGCSPGSVQRPEEDGLWGIWVRFCASRSISRVTSSLNHAAKRSSPGLQLSTLPVRLFCSLCSYTLKQTFGVLGYWLLQSPSSRALSLLSVVYFCSFTSGNKQIRNNNSNDNVDVLGYYEVYFKPPLICKHNSVCRSMQRSVLKSCWSSRQFSCNRARLCN